VCAHPIQGQTDVSAPTYNTALSRLIGIRTPFGKLRVNELNPFVMSLSNYPRRRIGALQLHWQLTRIFDCNLRNCNILKMKD
jgi:hypothetical protein